MCFLAREKRTVGHLKNTCQKVMSFFTLFQNEFCLENVAKRSAQIYKVQRNKPEIFSFSFRLTRT